MESEGLMARKRKISVLEDLLELGSRLSWKVGLPLALLCYLGFHDFSTLPAMSNGTPMNSVGVSIVRQTVVILCGILQYLVPFALIVGVIAGLFRRKQSHESLESNWRE